MNIRKITAKDKKSAFKEAVDIFGKDAIILSSRDTKDGVEVLVSDKIPYDDSYLDNFKATTNTAIASTANNNPSYQNYDDIASLKYLLEEQLSSLIWENKIKKDPLQAQVIQHLFKCGYSSEIAEQLVNTIPKRSELDIVDFSEIWKKVVASLINFTKDENPNNISGVVACYGSNGAGKTTSIMKMAAKYALAKGNKGVAIVSLDTEQVGKTEELNIYSKILNVSSYIVKSSLDLNKLLLELRISKELILLDLGFENIDLVVENSTNLIVVDSSMQQTSLQKILDRAAHINFNGAILTKLDYVQNLGEILSVLINYQINPLYYSNGTKVPDSLISIDLEQLFYKSLKLIDFSNNENIDKNIQRKYAEAYINDN